MQKRETLFFVVVCVVLGLIMVYSTPVLLAQSDSEDVGTDLNISANPSPILVQDIPNQTIARNSDLVNAFDLDTYFSDDEPLTYTSTQPNNITVTINAENQVSFSPDTNFTGTQTVVFNASDGVNVNNQTQSNTVYLNVVNDSEAPRWANPAASDSEIFQNENISFQASWTDNIALDNFVFSIDQGSGFVSFSPVSFSGVSNVSAYSTVISASAGTNVTWRFTGYDIAGNSNTTSTQSFVVATPTSTDTGDEDEDEDDEEPAEGDAVPPPVVPREDVVGFSVSPENFNVVMKQGATKTIFVEVSNSGTSELEITVSKSGLTSLTTELSDSVLNITSGESETVSLVISAEEMLNPDIYFGNLAFDDGDDRIVVPIAVNVQQLVISYDLAVTVPDSHKEVVKGGIVRGNITITQLEDVDTQELVLYYAVLDYEGEVYDSGQETVTIDSASQIYQKELVVPESAELGSYLFFARATNDHDTALDSDRFTVGAIFDVLAIVRISLLLLIIVGVSMGTAFFMIQRHRNRERLRLLNLYMMVTELKRLLKENKVEEAIGLYIRIKSLYGQPVSGAALHNKNELRENMKQLAAQISEKPVPGEGAAQDSAGKADEKEEGAAAEESGDEGKEDGGDDDGEEQEQRSEDEDEKEAADVSEDEGHEKEKKATKTRSSERKTSRKKSRRKKKRKKI